MPVYDSIHRPALALYQPEIAGNTGTLIRLSAGMGTQLHIIAPAAFRDDDTALRRAGMDYADIATVIRHADFDAFCSFARSQESRIILLTTRATASFLDIRFEDNDILLLGRESSGVPQNVHDRADLRVVIPMMEGARSLNQAVSGAMVLTEALRQTNGFSM